MKEESIVAIYLAIFNLIKPDMETEYEMVYDEADDLISRIEPLIEAYTPETK